MINTRAHGAFQAASSANSELTPKETWTYFRENKDGKTCSISTIFDWHKRFGKVERTSATISGFGDPVIPAADLSTFKSQLRGKRLQKREELEFAVTKFGVDFYKDVCSKWVETYAVQTWGNCNSNCNVIVMNYIFKVMEGNL